MPTIAYLKSVERLFLLYKKMGEDAMAQIEDEQLFWQANEESNSIAIIVKHLWGNMLSRWTNFLTEDGEKTWRERDAEFENNFKTKEELLEKWNEGWQCLLDAIHSITDADLDRIIYIRNEGHTILDAFNRQLAHYSSHIGQIVFIAKMLKNDGWKSLSIPRNKSKDYNTEKFSQDKGERNFTEEWLKKK